MQHHEIGTPGVSAKSGQAEPIRISWCGNTLCLPIDTAQKLAHDLSVLCNELLHKERMSKAIPATDEIRKSLQEGDVVVVRGDTGYECDYKVKWKPWCLPSGHWVLGLEGISVAYPLDKVVGVLSTAYSRGRV